MSLEELSAEGNRVLGAVSQGLPSSAGPAGAAATQANHLAPESAARSSLHPLFAVVPACALAAAFVHIATGYELQDDWHASRFENNPHTQ